MFPLISMPNDLLNTFIATPSVWNFIESTIMRLANGLRRRRTGVIVSKLNSKLANDLRVQSGPFEGMRYAQLQAACSAILPKLLGTYESEIHPLFEIILNQSYDIIVDIGSAEGYYAIGLALSFPSCQVVAFDTDPLARALCRQNIDINSLTSRVELREFASSGEVVSLFKNRRSLIVSDCEGYEDDLFMGIEAADLSEADILVETHEFIRKGVHQRIVDHFSLTHSVLEYHSIDDRQKARTYKTPFTSHLDENLREAIFAECRPVIMKWLYLRPIAVTARKDDASATVQAANSNLAESD